MTHHKPTTAFTALRVQRGQPAEADTALGRLLRDPTILALEHVHHIESNGNPIPTTNVGCWRRDSNGALVRDTILSTTGAACTVCDAHTAEAVLQSLSTDLHDVVRRADDRIGITDGGYTGSVRVLFMADGWVLSDEQADTNAVNLLEWENMLKDEGMDLEDLQEATDAVDWQRFCLPFLPKPTSAHDALAQQAAAERMVAATLAIHQANGMPALSQLDWTVAFSK